jgi:hypothetical protein
MKQRYKYEKTITLNQSSAVVCDLGNNHFVHTFNFTGIITPPFYLIGLIYEPYLWDDNYGETDKVFNYYDPLINARLTIAAQSTSDILGDGKYIDVGMSSFTQYSMIFQPGKLYDFSTFPIMISEMTLYFIVDVFFDRTITATMLKSLDNFMLMLGTN